MSFFRKGLTIYVKTAQLIPYSMFGRCLSSATSRFPANNYTITRLSRLQLGNVSSPGFSTSRTLLCRCYIIFAQFLWTRGYPGKIGSLGQHVRHSARAQRCNRQSKFFARLLKRQSTGTSAVALSGRKLY